MLVSSNIMLKCTVQANDLREMNRCDASEYDKLWSKVVMSEQLATHPASLPLKDLEAQCEIKRTRAGGPGGQHRNKVETAIVVTHVPTGVVARASERRSQHENRTIAIERLRVNLAIKVRTARPFESPSELWLSRCIGNKINVSRQHFDFACLLAESLDCTEASDYQVSDAARKLGCSTSQLIGLLRKEEAAFTYVNQKRRDAGLSALK